MNVKYIGLVFLSVWLILQGIKSIPVSEFHFPKEEKILPSVNLIAGLLLAGYCIKLKQGDLGLFLLGLWAVFNSSLFLYHVSFPFSNDIAHALGIIAGIMLILKR